MKIFICTAKVTTVNKALNTTLDGFEFLSREYKANSKESALEGFKQYLASNKNLTSFKNVSVR